MSIEPAKLDWAKNWLKTSKSLFIGGEWTSSQSGKTFSSINPTNREKLTELAQAGKIDVDLAVIAARKAFENSDWKNLTRRQRAETLNKIAQLIREHRAELATLETLDNGKTYKESFIDDLPESADVFDYYAAWIDKVYGDSVPVEKGFINFTQHEPLGVCALIVPWNFPLLLACWKIAPALAMGNTVIVKPSPFTSLTLVRLCEIIQEAKVLPKGVLNLVTGDLEAGEALSRHLGINKISFTGSTVVGKKVAEGASVSNLKRVSLELGGKSPNIIFDDVKDLDAVVARSFQAMFSHKAEKCSEPTRFIIHEAIYDAFVAKIVPKAQAVLCGDPFSPETDQGAQAHEAHFNKILNYIELGKKEGATLLAGGKVDPIAEENGGFFIRPTIFGDVKNSMRIAQEEIFGPVLCLIKFKNEAEAVQIANDTHYGLAAGVYTDDAKRAHRVATQLDAGMVFVNHYGCYDFASPFGGVKQSGWGKEMARNSLEEYTKLKSIWVRYS
ncbi:aldehyde dehydrogenase family protein [bacterium]|nr:aldehyde dehydrogenase family protein [bacterium]